MLSLLPFLKAIGGIFIVLSAWLGLQAYVRKQAGARKDQDMLEFMAHGCGGCDHASSCTTSCNH
jgi:acyl-CoA synthetase (AMP-forming)/AMP-acid ligase II